MFTYTICNTITIPFIHIHYTVRSSDVHVTLQFSRQNITAGDSLIINIYAIKSRGLESNLSLSCTGPGLPVKQGSSQQFVTELRYNFTGIRTSDAGVYTCTATMITPLLPHPLVSRQSTPVNITSMEKFTITFYSKQ